MHLNTCSFVYVYTKTVLNTNKNIKYEKMNMKQFIYLQKNNLQKNRVKKVLLNKNKYKTLK